LRADNLQLGDKRIDGKFGAPSGREFPSPLDSSILKEMFEAQFMMLGDALQKITKKANKQIKNSKTLLKAANAKGVVIFLFFLTAIFFAMSLENSKLSSEIENPRLVVKKSERKLEVFDGEKLLKTYKIALGFAPEGDKEQEGDGKTPLGEFYVFTKNDQSKFYLSLGISYPSIDDAERGLRENLISPEEHTAIVKSISEKKMPPQNTRLGGEIYIHGGGGAAKDWTWGCMALKDEEMREIFDAIPQGAPVSILP
jgi:hypothetical protein